MGPKLLRHPRSKALELMSYDFQKSRLMIVNSRRLLHGDAVVY